jgi:triosephosphate isomerase
MAAIKLVAGNWKMNGTVAGARALVGELIKRVESPVRCRVAVCPPFPLLATVVDLARTSAILVGAQDCHAKEKGAHTGDVSARLIAELGCAVVIVGHSERRADHGESDAAVRAKAETVLAVGLQPIICVGETEKQRNAGETMAVVTRQVRESWPSSGTAERCVIAYEPVWAIGTGRTPTIKDVESVHAHIRTVAAGMGVASRDLTILYGGSVKGANARELMSVTGVDGALVGVASLDASEFWAIVAACGRG